MSALEKRQGHVVNLRLAPIELEFLPAVRSRAACAHLWFPCARLGLRSNDNPRPTFRTSDARAHNAMGHTEIIWAAGLPWMFAMTP